MGANASQLEKDIGSELFPQNEHYFGLVNFGNTCYSNSVLQALYFCKPFRDKVLEYKAKNKRNKETLLTCLADLFYRYFILYFSLVILFSLLFNWAESNQIVASKKLNISLFRKCTIFINLTTQMTATGKCIGPNFLSSCQEVLRIEALHWCEQDYYSCVDPCPWYCSIVTQKRKVGTIAPKKFIARLRKEKVEFDNYMQQVNKQIYRVTTNKIWPSFHSYKQKYV